VNVLAIESQTPDTLYAGTDIGVFKSTNGGANWTAINGGLPYYWDYEIGTYHPDVHTLVIDPQTPDTLYAAVSCYGDVEDGVFKSTDGGANWTAINNGLATYLEATALAINPQTPDTLYVGTSGSGGGGVFKSTCGGANWRLIGLTNTFVHSLAVDPQTPDTLYASTEGGLFKGLFKGGPPLLQIAVLNTGNNSINCGYWDAGNFSGLSPIGGASTEAPSITRFMDRQYMAVKGASTNNIYLRYQDSTGTWTPWEALSGSTSKSPAIAAFINRLYMVVKGGSNNNLYVRFMDASGTWDSSWTVISGQTTEAPALTVFNDRLYLFVKGAANNNIYYRSMDNFGIWGSWFMVPPGTTPKSIGLSVFNGRLYVFVKGTVNNFIYYRSMTSGGWGDTPGDWGSWAALSGQTMEAPSVTVLDDRLFVAVKGLYTNNAFTRSMDLWGNWDTSWTMVPANTNKTPVLSPFYKDP
jgi:hypothetical protein